MDTVLGRALEEAARDCAAHVNPVSVVYAPPPGIKRHYRPKIVAALLRVLAEHTDGFCANRGADDADLIATGMVFRFTSDAKRDEFIARMRVYLRLDLRDRLSATKI